MQLGISGKSDVLLLHRGINKCRIEVVVAVILIVHPNALGKNQLHASLADTVSEMHQLGGIAGLLGSELEHTAEVLVISVLAPLGNNRLVGNDTKMLQYQKTTHQTYRMCGATVLVTIQRDKCIFESLPVYFMAKLKKGMLVIKHI